MNINITINGENKEFDVPPDEILLDLLRREGYTSVKEGCRTGDCGACTVLVDGKAVNSCLLFAGQLHGQQVTTLEGLEDKLISLLQESFLEMGAVQCGFCIPGMLISAYSLLSTKEDPSREEIKSGLDGNLCRCTGYVSQIKAVEQASERLKRESTNDG